MSSIEEVFLLLVGCIVHGNADNLRDVCTSSEMQEIPYQPLAVDQRLPSFEKGHWFAFPISESTTARLEILIKNGAVLQAGVEIIYPQSATSGANDSFVRISNAATAHYGQGYGQGVSMDLGDIDNLNYGDSKSVFYVIKTTINHRPAVVFRAGNRRFWP